MKGFFRLSLLIACLLVLLPPGGIKVRGQVSTGGTSIAPEVPDAEVRPAGTWNIYEPENLFLELTPYSCGLFVSVPSPLLFAGTPITGIVSITPGTGQFKSLEPSFPGKIKGIRGLYNQGDTVAVLFSERTFMGLFDPSTKSWLPRSNWLQTGTQVKAAGEEQGNLWVALEGRIALYHAGKLVKQWPYPQGLPPLKLQALVSAESSAWLVLESLREQAVRWLAKVTPEGFETLYSLEAAGSAASLMVAALSPRYVWLAFGTAAGGASRLFAWEILTSSLSEVVLPDTPGDGSRGDILITALETAGDELWIGTAGAGVIRCSMASSTDTPGDLVLEVLETSPEKLNRKTVYDFVPAPGAMWVLSTGLVVEYKK